MSSPNSSPLPPNNPILSAYEQFVRDTPLVTRYVLTTLLVTWFAGFFVDLSYATATVPFFCLFKFEIYRIIISPFICQSILSLVFAVFSFTDNGKRLEFSMGSTAFGWYLLTMACCTNVAFLVLLFLAYGLSGESGFLWYKSIGIWTILFGLIATECSKAPRDSQRRLFFFNVPTIYFPIALWGLFALFGGVDFADLLSVGVGYASGYGYLDKLKLKLSRFNQWEETILSNFTQRPGWIVGHAATGDDAWSTENNSGGVSASLFVAFKIVVLFTLLTFTKYIPSQSSGFSLFSAAPANQQQEASSTGIASPGRVMPPPDPAFPSTGGQALGSTPAPGPTRRGTANTNTGENRTAMLEAAEKRAAKLENDNNV
jgi:membrane associated rhomboid family serine protease